MFGRLNGNGGEKTEDEVHLTQRWVLPEKPGQHLMPKVKQHGLLTSTAQQSTALHRRSAFFHEPDKSTKLVPQAAIPRSCHLSPHRDNTLSCMPTRATARSLNLSFWPTASPPLGDGATGVREHIRTRKRCCATCGRHPIAKPRVEPSDTFAKRLPADTWRLDSQVPPRRDLDETGPGRKSLRRLLDREYSQALGGRSRVVLHPSSH